MFQFLDRTSPWATAFPSHNLQFHSSGKIISRICHSGQRFIIHVIHQTGLNRSIIRNSRIPAGLSADSIRRNLQKCGCSRRRPGHQGGDLCYLVTKSDCLVEIKNFRMPPSTGITSRFCICSFHIAFNDPQLSKIISYVDKLDNVLTIFPQGLFLLPLHHHHNWLRQRGDQNYWRSRLLPSLWHRRHPFHALRPRRCWRHTRWSLAGSNLLSHRFYTNLSFCLSFTEFNLFFTVCTYQR